ncbi:MAG TPA: MraY family glycosyltransferase, partial [Candidatus Limnocylindrales bacterium]|nr:MraY family glycosyltransferase [Candidatus Limnocylindrales bacterium]
GLAAGTAAIIFLAMAIVSTITDGNVNVLGVQLIGFGACLGFLFFNFSPSKIFMGDAGSMLLGFVLATTYLLTIRHPFSAQLVLGSIFIFAYPAMDVTFAVYRRFISRLPVFKADQGHIHHVLLSLGFSVRKTVLLIYLVNIIFASLAVLLLILPVPSYVILGVGIVTVAGAVYIIKLLLKISRTNGVGIYNTGEG